MFKNLKQKLENLSVNSPPGKSGPPQAEEGKPEEKIHSSPSEETTDKTAKSSELKAETMSEISQSSQGQSSVAQSENSDPSALLNEDLEKTNRVLLSQIKELEDSKNEIGKKLSRRIGELEEQIELDRQAKRDLEHSYALMLDEKDELITVLKTQVQLLKSSQAPTSSASLDDREDQTSARAESLDCPMTLEEVALLKEKVKKLELLLTKCKDTIKSNRERSKQLMQEKEELRKSFEEKLVELRLKHEKELNSKVADMQEEIKSLTEVRSGLDGELVTLTSKLSEKEKTIESKEKVFNDKMEKVQKDMERLNATFRQQQQYVKGLQVQTSTETATKARVDSLPSEAKRGDSTPEKSSLEAASGAAAAAPEESFASAKEELEKLKELYELKSKELILVIEDRETVRLELANQRQKFATVLQRYDEQMKVVQGELFERMKPGPFEAGLRQEVHAILSGEESEKQEASHEVAPDTRPVETSDVEATRAKLERVLQLLERCSKEIDSRDAMDKRWKERLTEAEGRNAAQLRESRETIDRLNGQIMELTNRENLLNANLEAARQQSDAILAEQRAEMQALQATVGELLEREKQLRTQIQKTKMMCDAEVARVTAENLESVQRLSDTFQETQRTLSELSGELVASKEHSEAVIGSLERDLDDKCRMLQRTADYIETKGDDGLRAAFMKIVLECSSEPDAPEGVDPLPDPAKVVVESNGPEASSSPRPSVDISAENCKPSVGPADRKEVRIDSRCQQELIDFDLPGVENKPPPGEKRNLNRITSNDLKHFLHFNLDLVTKICSHRSAMSNLSAAARSVKISDPDESSGARNLRHELLSKVVKFSESPEKCRRLEAEISFLVETNQELARKLSRVEEECAGLRLELGTKESDEVEDNSGIVLSLMESNVPGKEESDRKVSEFHFRIEGLTRELTASRETIKSLEEMNARLEKDLLLQRSEMENREGKGDSEVECTSLAGGPQVGKVVRSRDSVMIEGMNSVGSKSTAVTSQRDRLLTEIGVVADDDCLGLKRENKSSGDLESLLAENALLKSTVDKYEKENLARLESFDSLKLELEALVQEGSKMKLKLGESEIKLEEFGSLKERLAQKELEYKCLEGECEERRKRLEEIRETLELERSRILSLEEEVQRGEIVRQELKESLEELKCLKDEILFHRSENEKLMERLNGLEEEVESQSRHVEEIAQAKEGLQWELDAERRSSEEQRKNLESLKAEIDSLRSKLVEREDLNFGLTASLESLQRNKEVEEGSRATRQELESAIERLQLENSELEGSITRLEKDLEWARLESDSRADKLQSKEAELEEALKARRDLATTIEGLQKEKENFSAERQIMESTIEKLKLEKIELDDNVAKLSETLEEARLNSLTLQSKEVALEEAERTKRDLTSSLEKLQKDKDDFSIERQTLGSMIVGLKLKNAELHKDIEKHNETLDRMRSENASHLDLLRSQEAKLEDAARMKHDLTSSLENLQKEKESLSADKQDLDSALERLKLENVQLHDSIAKLKGTIEKETSDSATHHSQEVKPKEVENTIHNLGASPENLQKNEESSSVENPKLELTIDALRLENAKLNVDVMRLKEALNGSSRWEGAFRVDELHPGEVKLGGATGVQQKQEEIIREEEDGLNQNTPGEHILSIRQLEEKVRLLTDMNRSISEERDNTVSSKNKLLSRCFTILSDTQAVLSGAVTKVASLESRVSDLTRANARLKERLHEMGALITSLDCDEKVTRGGPMNSTPIQENEAVPMNDKILDDSTEISLSICKLGLEKESLRLTDQEIGPGEDRLRQQLEALKLELALKEQEIEEMRMSHASLVQRCEEAEMALNRRHVYYNGVEGVTTVEDTFDQAMSGEFKMNPLGALFDSFKARVTASDSGRLEKLGEDVEGFDLLLDSGESSIPSQERAVEKRKSAQHGDTTDKLPASELPSSSPERDSLLGELEQVRRLLEESRREVALLRQREMYLVSEQCHSDSKSRSPLTSRENLDSLDLSQDLFSTPERSSRSREAMTCVDDHSRAFVDLSPMKNEAGSGCRVESGNEKSDSDLLDLSDAQAHPQGRHYPSVELTYEYLARQYHFLSKEVERLNSELRFYYANSHVKHQYHHQDSIVKHDSFLDLTEPTELEYLRNVLYKYMLGTETKTLAKVICTVVRFSDDQTKKVLDREESKVSVFGTKK